MLTFGPADLRLAKRHQKPTTERVFLFNFTHFLFRQCEFWVPTHHNYMSQFTIYPQYRNDMFYDIYNSVITRLAEHLWPS